MPSPLQSYLDEFVRGSAQGLYTEIQESGSNLSDGQKQLVCLARALLRRSRVVVLDEATSKVDQRTDRMVQLAVRGSMSACTVLTVAHRLSTVLDADRILVLDDGRIQALATPEEMLADSDSELSRLLNDDKK